MERLRREVEPREAGLDPKTLARLDEYLARQVDEGRLRPATCCPWPAAVASPT